MAKAVNFGMTKNTKKGNKKKLVITKKNTKPKKKKLLIRKKNV